jgi:hypothetical protein
VLRAGLAANRGEWYRYPLIVRFFRPLATARRELG